MKHPAFIIDWYSVFSAIHSKLPAGFIQVVKSKSISLSVEGSWNLFNIHYPPKVKIEPALLISSFVHSSSINELENMKLSEHICYEMVN